MECADTPNPCGYTFETDQETSQPLRMSIDIAMRHCEVTHWWCRDCRRLNIHLRLALACEVEELVTALKRHKNPPPARCCVRGRWRQHRAEGLALGPMPWCSIARTHVRAHGFVFDGNSAICSSVGAAFVRSTPPWALLALRWVFRPCAVPFSLALGRSNIHWAVRPRFGRFSLVWCFVVALGWPHKNEAQLSKR